MLRVPTFKVDAGLQGEYCHWANVAARFPTLRFPLLASMYNRLTYACLCTSHGVLVPKLRRLPFFFHICSIVLCELSVTPHSCLVGFGIRSSYLLTCTYKHFTLRVTERFESAYGRGSLDLVPNEYRSVHPGWYASPACCLRPLNLGLGKQWYWHGLKACLVLVRCNSNYFNCLSKIFWHCQLSEMLLRTYCRRADSDWLSLSCVRFFVNRFETNVRVWRHNWMKYFSTVAS